MKSLFRKIRHNIVVKKLTVADRASILDTSSQDGGFLSVLLKSNSDKSLNVYGVDLNKIDIEKAQRSIPNGVFKITDNTSLPFPDKTFDMVISSFTLHHLPNPTNSMKEMKRVVKDNGIIYLIDMIAKNKMFNFFLKHITCPEPYHFEKFYSMNEVEELLSETGLTITKKTKTIVFPTFTVFTPIVILELKKAFEYR